MLDFQVVDIQTAGTDGRALYALHVKGTAFLWHQVNILAMQSVSGNGYGCMMTTIIFDIAPHYAQWMLGSTTVVQFFRLLFPNDSTCLHAS